ncbi:uncharacterized protein LOC110263235 isoform X2 [Arachis ipaensis]|uniref:uncharacterized protein LOC110263235 isoform X2 n=1 Tax=Arachis ipaensis TaxID=130454 RepID=UPI000A2B7F76|nr:uncharacterized protein LOC110263235 isoform X2 [Arachis ipaensis]
MRRKGGSWRGCRHSTSPHFCVLELAKRERLTEEGDAHGRGRNCLCAAVVDKPSRLAIVATVGIVAGEKKTLLHLVVAITSPISAAAENAQGADVWREEDGGRRRRRRSCCCTQPSSPLLQVPSSGSTAAAVTGVLIAVGDRRSHCGFVPPLILDLIRNCG